MSGSVPLASIGGHLVHLPVQVGDSVASRFIFDTGIGLDLVSKSLLARVGGRLTGETYTGRRMSGQTLAVPLARIPSIAVGTLRRDDVLVGVFDLALPPEMAAIEGFLAPTFFGERPFTLRRRAGALTWGAAGEPERSSARGPGAPLNVRWDGPAVSLFVDLDLPDGSRATVEVDTGSDHLILDRTFMARFGVREEDPGVDQRNGVDESGHAYVRYFAPISGGVSIRGLPEIGQSAPLVQFQAIICDGLLGDEFLRSHDVTFDLRERKIFFARASD
jgi:hypothetical protein